jgi:hypothetical protein
MAPQVARYDAGENRYVREDSLVPAARAIRTQVTAAQVNAGFTLLQAVPGFVYQLADAAMVSGGGAAAGATAVQVLGTRTAGPVVLMSVLVGALTQSAQVDLGDPNGTALADGTTYTALDVNTAITVGKTGSSLTGSTYIEVALEYTMIPV